MKHNIEIKAPVSSWLRLNQLAASISDTPAEKLIQDDTFFLTPQGRLKLRQLQPNYGELIYYTRPDTPTAKESNYIISKTYEPMVLKEVLAAAWGILATVRKVRTLYRVGPTRIHLDEVLELGNFMELEYVLTDNEDRAKATEVVHKLMAHLEIPIDSLISVSYFDLLQLTNSPYTP